MQTAEGRTNSSYDYDEPMVSRGLCMHAQAAPTLRGSAAQFGGASSRRFGGYGVSKAYAPGSSGLFPGCPPPSAAQGPTVFGSSGTLNYGYGSGSRTKQSARLAGSPASAGLPLAQGRSTFGGPSAEEVCAMSDEAEWDDEDMQVGCSLYDDLDGEADSCPVPDDIVASAPKPKGIPHCPLSWFNKGFLRSAPEIVTNPWACSQIKGPSDHKCTSCFSACYMIFCFVAYLIRDVIVSGKLGKWWAWNRRKKFCKLLHKILLQMSHQCKL